MHAFTRRIHTNISLMPLQEGNYGMQKKFWQILHAFMHAQLYKKSDVFVTVQVEQKITLNNDASTCYCVPTTCSGR